jgi:rhomboid protease GluP
MNMFALVQIGQTIERFIGSWRFLVAYLIALISGNILSLVWNDISISAGASGAVFGMFGVFLALLTTKLIARSMRRSLLMSMISVIGFNLIFGLQAGIDNAGHIGGLIGGMLAGYAMVPALRKHEKSLRGYVLPGLLGVLIIALAFITLAKLPNDYPAYDKRMEEITQLEEKAIAVFNNSGEQSDPSLPGKINSEGIPAWKQIIRLTGEIDSLNLPDAYKERNKNFRKYAALRLKSYELRYKAVTADSQNYDEEIQRTEQEIEKMLKPENKK